MSRMRCESPSRALFAECFLGLFRFGVEVEVVIGWI